MRGRVDSEPEAVDPRQHGKRKFLSINNCGTQLLFADDESVDEEIPGEKIIDAETEEKDYTVEEPEGESKPKEDPDLDEELEEETEELALDKLLAEEDGEEDEDLTEEIILVDEIKAAESGGKGESENPEGKEEPAELKNADKAKSEEEEEADEEEDEGEDEEAEEPAAIEVRLEAPADDETAEVAASTPEEEVLAGKTGEPPPPAGETEPIIEYLTDDQDRDKAEPAEEASPKAVTFDTQELEGIGKTVELGQEKIDRFLEVLAKKEAEVEPPPQGVREPTGTLPPWASTMKGAPVFPDETGPVGALGQAVADTARSARGGGGLSRFGRVFGCLNR